MTRRYCLFALLLFLLHPYSGFAQITIDGLMDDWPVIPALPGWTAPVAPQPTLGGVASVKAAHDQDYLYLQIRFLRPRPFTSPAKDKLIEGFEDDFGYLELDNDHDGQWEYRTYLSQGRQPGYNNLTVFKSDKKGNPDEIVLFPEGHRKFKKRGPLACFSMDAGAVEMRLPRKELDLDPVSVHLRARVHYRDENEVRGLGVTFFAPENDWFLFKFGPPVSFGRPPVLIPGQVTVVPAMQSQGMLATTGGGAKAGATAVTATDEAMAEDGEPRHVAEALPPPPEPQSAPAEHLMMQETVASAAPALDAGFAVTEADKGADETMVETVAAVPDEIEVEPASATVDAVMTDNVGGQPEPVIIDGKFDDWREAQYIHPVKPGAKVLAANPLGAINQVCVATSLKFIYLRVDFNQPRPHTLTGNRPGDVEESYAYARLDLDMNGQWDAEVRLMNTDSGAMRCQVVGREGDIILWPEGDLRRRPDGPRAAMSPDRKSVEISLPREPLGVTRRLALQALVRYRYPKGPWRQATYPLAGKWYVCEMQDRR